MKIVEYREIKEVTELDTWTINSFVFANAPNPLNEISIDRIYIAAMNVLLKKNLEPGWQVQQVESFYTKNSPLSKGLAGQFWLGVIIKMIKEVKTE